MNFTHEEYATRLSKTRAQMDVRGIDLLFVTDPSNMAWLTGYDGWSFYTHQCVIVSPTGEPAWWGRGIDALGALRTVIMADDNVVGYEDSYVQNPEKHPMETLAALVLERGWNANTIGVEMDNYYYSAAAHASLVTNLPSSHFMDATGLVNWQRAIKSDAEIGYMRKAARIVEHMHRTIIERAEPGLKKNELVAAIYAASIEGVDDCWGDYPAIVPLTPSGMDATAPHLTWDDSPMKSGECTFFEIAGVHKRYHCPQSRTLFLGEPPDKYRRAEAAVLEAVDAGLAMAKPGNLCADIANAFNSTLNKHGLKKDNRCGYAIGLSYPPDWGERTMSFRSNDQTILQAGMTFHFMPALWLDDGGLEVTEPILITDTGVECLCNTPRVLAVK
ncbi:MAG: ectoine hydrolase [Granulosicoccus sp.]|jgi:ectoine hydrolase